MVTQTTFRHRITTLDELREVIPVPSELALRKQLDVLDEHCRAFIARSPFLLLATSSRNGDCDVSPKGDAPGFVQVIDEHTLVIPDRPGNQRLDSLRNIIENPHAGLLFIIPGVEWTLRVNGGASIIRDEDVLERCAVNGKRPPLGLAIDVEEAFMHCPKCFARSNVWDTTQWMMKEEQPSWAAVMRDHIQLQQVPLETVEKAIAADRSQLY
jgi:PPOX class probable FMN-dependent enzyme